LATTKVLSPIPPKLPTIPLNREACSNGPASVAGDDGLCSSVGPAPGPSRASRGAAMAGLLLPPADGRGVRPPVRARASPGRAGPAAVRHDLESAQGRHDR